MEIEFVFKERIKKKREKPVFDNSSVLSRLYAEFGLMFVSPVFNYIEIDPF